MANAYNLHAGTGVMAYPGSITGGKKMTCYYPIRGYRSKEPNANGKYTFTAAANNSFYDLKMEVPCSKCIGCRIARSKDWAMRCYHETSLHENNCFITLTYNNEHERKTLEKRDFMLFMKRLRKQYENSNMAKIKFFHCGEYGDVCRTCGYAEKFCKSKGCQNYIKGIGREHHHAIIFGLDFQDKEIHSTKKGITLYRSTTLEKLWSDPDTGESYGYSTVGAATFESAAYVARYILKKFNNKDPKKVEAHYGTKLPEYVTMSRGGRDGHGIAYDWFQKYKTDVYPGDFVMTKKLQKLKPPRYYDNIYDIESPEELKIIKAKRIQRYNEKAITPSEKRASLEILERKTKKLIRELEQ